MQFAVKAEAPDVETHVLRFIFVPLEVLKLKVVRARDKRLRYLERELRRACTGGPSPRCGGQSAA